MSTVNNSSPYRTILAAGLILRVVASAVASGIIRQVGQPGVQLTGLRQSDIAAGQSRKIGPFPTDRTFQIEATTGTIEVTTEQPEFDLATALANIEVVDASFTLREMDNGKIFRCENSSGITITVPSTLPEGFNVAASQWGTGSVTFAAGTGATARSSALEVADQYETASLLVMKNNAGETAAEFTVGGSAV